MADLERSTAAGEPIIQIQGVTKTFGKGKVTAVNDVSLSIDKGDIYGVIGYSGAGKSTLVRLINALEVPDAGTVAVDGRLVSGASESDLRSIRRDIGMIFQHFNLLSARTVAANVGYPLKLAKWSKKERAERVSALLDFVGIGEKAKSYPSQLSGGQKQRVGIARALATSPQVLLADEATSALDPETTREVLDLLRRVNKELGITIVVITHSMTVVQHLCNKVAVMEHGNVVEAGDVYSLLADPQHPATQRFIQSALHDRPTNDVVERLRARHPGRLVVAALTGNDDGGLPLNDLGVPATVVYGGISEVGERPFGSVTIELGGDEPAIARAIEILARSATVTDLGTARAPRTDPRWNTVRSEAVSDENIHNERGLSA